MGAVHSLKKNIQRAGKEAGTEAAGGQSLRPEREGAGLGGLGTANDSSRGLQHAPHLGLRVWGGLPP